MGHGSCTCEGAAFEYFVNLEFELRRHKVRDKAEIIFVTNEYELGDFGVDGMHFRRGGYITPSKIFAESLFAERGIQSITKAMSARWSRNSAHVETLSGERVALPFDMAMLLPPFAGVGLKAFNRNSKDITSSVFASGCGLHAKAAYAVEGGGLAATIPPDSFESVCGRHRVCSSTSDFPIADELARPDDLAGAIAHEHAVGNDRPSSGSEYLRHDDVTWE